MARIIAGMASSHAFAFVPPEGWDKYREGIRQRFAQRYGMEARVQPGVERETLEQNSARFATIRTGLDHLRDKLTELQPDALIVIGDDQNENYTVDNLPQFAIYTGEDTPALDRMYNVTTTVRSERDLAKHLLNDLVEDGFDLSFSDKFASGQLLAHAHGPALRVVDPEAKLPVVLLFVNAIHVPGPPPSRCYAFGQALARSIESWRPDARVALYASGGLSHFTAGFPWRHFWENNGEHGFGAIVEDFDRKVVEWMRAGEGSKLATLNNRDLIANGDVELRQWIVLQGALGDRKPDFLEYEPFYRATIGMAVGYWGQQN